MPTRTSKNLIFLLFLALLAIAGCTKPDRSEEAERLKQELHEMLYKSPEQALVRVDSAEQAGVFSEAMANLIRTNQYGAMGQTRLAVFYGEKILNVPELKREGDTYYSALLMLIGLIERNGEYGKVIRLSDEIIADVENERKQGGGMSGISEQVALRVKCRALTFKGDCEYHLGHLDEAERFYLEGINLMMDGVTHPDDYWMIDPLLISVIETTEFYLEEGKAEKAQVLLAVGDTALARLDCCPDVPDQVHHGRHNNITIGQAMIYAANGQRDKAEALFLKHRQAENLSVYDIGGDARYLAMTDRYDEAIRLFHQADSLYLAKGNAINTAYIKNYMMNLYKTLQKAGRNDDIMALSDRMRQLTDSIHLQERKVDVEQQEVIRQKEQEIISRRQSAIIYRILVIAAFLICLLIVYFLWRSYKYNKVLLAKNRRLLAEIEERERQEQQAIEQLQSEPENTLTAGQQLFRRICTLMTEQQPYTDENLNRDILAQLLGTNAKYVVQAIHECSHGETVTDFITRYRLEHVARLLRTTDDPIAIIGEMSGIPSRATLARLFRNAYGMTCTEFRAVAKEKSLR